MRPGACIKVAIVLLLTLSTTLRSQSLNNGTDISSKQNLLLHRNTHLRQTDGDVYAHLFMGSLVILFVTPSIIYEDKHVYFGLGRELSITFGKREAFRLSAEYTYVFRANLKHNFRASLKYDILSSLSRSMWIDLREFLSLGAGYYIDHDGGGIFPEVTAGFRIGTDVTYYLYPYAKLSHTFMTSKSKPDNTVFSIGLAISYNPF